MSGINAHPGHQSTSSLCVVVLRDKIAARVTEPGDEITALHARGKLTIVGVPAAPGEGRQ